MQSQCLARGLPEFPTAATIASAALAATVAGDRVARSPLGMILLFHHSIVLLFFYYFLFSSKNFSGSAVLFEFRTF